ncbi:MAG: hypothetical protein GX946_11205 [Oligosphaeraceae bacterium]|nr:hypothetical protein [Oligosphaeraceae bacterium]
MKKFLLATLIFCTGFCLADQLWLHHTFDEWKNTEKKDVSPIGVCGGLPGGFLVEKDTDGNGYLSVNRDPEVGSRSLRLGRRYNIMDFFDFTMTARCRMHKSPGAYIWFTSPDGKPRGGISFNYRTRHILGYDADMNWQDTKIALPAAEEWFDFKVEFHEAEKTYNCIITTADGKVQTSQRFPYLHHKGIRHLEIGNVPPAGTGMDFDDIRIAYADKMNLENRLVGCEGAIITCNGEAIEHSGGVLATPLEVTLPATFDIQFAGKKALNSVYVQIAKHFQFVKIEVIGSDAAGSGENRLAAGHIAKEHVRYQNNFVINDFIRAKVILTGSGSVVLEKLCFAGAPQASVSEKGAAFRKNIYGEFRSAVWQLQNEAHLHLFNDRADKQSHPVSVTVVERFSQKEALSKQELTLKPGKNVVDFPLGGLSNGDYVVTISDASGESQGKFQRLIRLYRKFDEAPAPESLGVVTGQKLFFPDGHWLEKFDNLTFSTCQAQQIPVVLTTGSDEDFAKYGHDISMGSDGKIRVDYFTLNRNWDADSQKWYRATTDDIASGKWEIQALEKMPQRDGISSYIGEAAPEVARGDWEAKVSPGGREVYKIYDPTVDGPVNLRQMRVRYSGAVANNTLMWKGNSLDWGVIKAVPRAWYKVWRRGLNDTLILDTKPLLTDKPSYGDFEEPDTTHDNFCGQWLSNDGETLYFCHARWLLPNAPYHTPRYDNMNGLRILYIWRSTDGIHFEPSAFVPPDESDSHDYQHYGATVLRLAKSNGMFIGFVQRYRSDSQQIDSVLTYSWDGGAWHRPQGPAFLKNGEPDEFNCANVNISSGMGKQHPHIRVINIGKESYFVLEGCSNYYHLQAAQLVAFIPDLSKLSVPFLKKAQPYLEEWPIFKQLGGYDGFIAHCRKAGKNIAIAKYRRDGYFVAKTEGKAATMITRPLKASGSLVANIKIAANGKCKIELLDTNNKPIPGYIIVLAAGYDEIDGCIFDALPDTPFKVRLTMTNTELYTLNF